MRRKIVLFFLLIGILGLVVYFFRVSLLRSCATFLIQQDSLQKADALFVLSGGGYDRGNEAVKLFRHGFVNKIICTGGNVAIELLVFNIDTLECYATASNLKRQLIPDSIVAVLAEGTSTKEEAALIIDYCRKNRLKKVIVISSLLHTRRVQRVFKEKFEDAGVKLIVRGAPSSRFDELNWWTDENGLIAVNNEWIKTVYYWLKY